MGELTRTAVTHRSEVIPEKPPPSKSSGNTPVSGVALGVRASTGIGEFLKTTGSDCGRLPGSAKITSQVLSGVEAGQ
jgi:hypothetical protein